MDATTQRHEHRPATRPSNWLRGLPYLFPLLLLVLYVSAITSPPSRHTELVQWPDSGDSFPLGLAPEHTWDTTTRDWQWGSVTVQPSEQGSPSVAVDTQALLASLSTGQTRMGRLALGIEDGVQRIGDFIAMLLGFDDDDEQVSGAQDGSGLTTWAESSVYVESTHSLYASRPSSFGPHILLEPLEAPLHPITAFAPSTSHGCASPANSSDEAYLKPPRQGWVALVQRGHCPFSQKVRYAQDRGAVAVVFGDQSPEEGGISGIGGLLTPWSPDDTSDVRIPSTFVSRASYLALLQSWSEQQTSPDKPTGLLVILSKDELFAWPLLDLLLLVLFLPSLLTLFTVFTQRLRILRQQQLDRAPRDAVARLPVFIWGEQEKPVDAVPEGTDDEERAVGVPTESTSLLRPALGEERPRRFGRLVPRWARRWIGLPVASSKGKSTELAPRHPRRYDTSAECAICLCDFEKGERVMALPCGHIFHEAEITPWLLDTKRVCPICRASITLDPVEDSSSESTTTTTPPPATPAQSVPIAPPPPGPTSTSSTLPSSPSSAPAALPPSAGRQASARVGSSPNRAGGTDEQ